MRHALQKRGRPTCFPKTDLLQLKEYGLLWQSFTVMFQNWCDHRLGYCWMDIEVMYLNILWFYATLNIKMTWSDERNYQAALAGLHL